MELKISLKKAFSFLATIVPGSVLFYLFEIGHPGTIGWFLSISSLGYKSRIFLLLLALFLLGYSFVKFLAAVCGSFGWLLGRTIRLPIFDRHPYDYATAPWRDKRWRAAYTRRFAIDAPPDISVYARLVGRGQDRGDLQATAGRADFSGVKRLFMGSASGMHKRNIQRRGMEIKIPTTSCSGDYKNWK